MTFSGWDAALAAVKAMLYAATLAGAGMVFFLGYCQSQITPAQRRRTVSMLRGAGLGAVLSSAAYVAVTAGSLGGSAAAMWNASLVHMVWQAGQGRATVVRLLGVALAVAGAGPRREPSVPALVGAAIAATSFAWVGHVHAPPPGGEPGWVSGGLPVLLLGLHLLGIAFWIGALPALLIVTMPEEPARIAAAAARFGAIAAWVVAVLIAAGGVLSCWFLGGVSQLWISVYGRCLSAKLLGVAGLLCLAAFNKWRLMPGLHAGRLGAVMQLRGSIRFEMHLAWIILAVTAVLTTGAGPPAFD